MERITQIYQDDDIVDIFLKSRQADALANPPKYPPYHEGNRSKYLIPEPTENFLVKTIKEEPNQDTIGVKRESLLLDNDENRAIKRPRRLRDIWSGAKEALEVEDGGLLGGWAREKRESLRKEIIEHKKEETAETPNNEAKPLTKNSVVLKAEAQTEAKNMVQAKGEPEVQVVRFRRVKTQIRKDIYDLP